jgi:hypothetical protein
MKPCIIVGCLMMASTGFAQQSPQTARVDSLKNLDNMPVIRDVGNPVPMPVRKGAGMAVDMPTHRLQPATGYEQEKKVLEEQLKHIKIDSSSRINPRKKSY